MHFGTNPPNFPAIRYICFNRCTYVHTHALTLCILIDLVAVNLCRVPWTLDLLLYRSYRHLDRNNELAIPVVDAASHPLMHIYVLYLIIDIDLHVDSVQILVTAGLVTNMQFPCFAECTFTHNDFHMRASKSG